MKSTIIIISILINSFLFCQSDSTKTFILPELKVTQHENGKPVIYDFEKDVNKFIVTADSIKADPEKYKYGVSIRDIMNVSVINGTHFWGAAAGGAIFGYVVGFFAIGYFTIDGPAKFNLGHAIVGGFIGAFPFGLITGLVGILFPKYEVYEFKSNDLRVKRLQVMRAFKKSSIIPQIENGMLTE